MEQFPSSFVAQKIQSNIINNRFKKIEQDMKDLRKKIVKSFQGSVHYHSEVSHEMLSDLSEEEQKNFYCMVKDELQQRGFVVRGKIVEKTLSLIVFSNVPRTNEMDRVLKQYSEDHEDKNPESKQSLSVPNSPSKSTERKSKIPSVPKTPKVKKVRSSSIPSGDKAKKHLSKIPRLQTQTATHTLKQNVRSSSVPTLIPQTMSVHSINTTNTLEMNDRSDLITSASSNQYTPLSPQPPQSAIQSPQSTPLPNSPKTNQSHQIHPSQSADLNMEFIMNKLNKLKQANLRKKT
jgi:hypothetical protein